MKDVEKKILNELEKILGGQINNKNYKKVFIIDPKKHKYIDELEIIYKNNKENINGYLPSEYLEKYDTVAIIIYYNDKIEKFITEIYRRDISPLRYEISSNKIKINRDDKTPPIIYEYLLNEIIKKGYNSFFINKIKKEFNEAEYIKFKSGNAAAISLKGDIINFYESNEKKEIEITHLNELLKKYDNNKIKEILDFINKNNITLKPEYSVKIDLNEYDENKKRLLKDILKNLKGASISLISNRKNNGINEIDISSLTTSDKKILDIVNYNKNGSQYILFDENNIILRKLDPASSIQKNNPTFLNNIKKIIEGNFNVKDLFGNKLNEYEKIKYIFTAIRNIKVIKYDIESKKFEINSNFNVKLNDNYEINEIEFMVENIKSNKDINDAQYENLIEILKVSNLKNAHVGIYRNYDEINIEIKNKNDKETKLLYFDNNTKEVLKTIINVSDKDTRYRIINGMKLC